jgi:hypothetical protein
VFGSQYGQDRLALNILGGLRGGFFLDSGASDGLQASNTWLLETKYAWQGVCVEPDPAFFAKLTLNRRCVCVNCCLYDREGEVAFLEAATLGGILEEYEPGFLRWIEQQSCGVPPVVRRNARTPLSVLREACAPKIIDYWSLDTEGSELAILKSFPFKQFTFRVLTVEHNRHAPTQRAIQAFLDPLGFERVGAVFIDDCYVNRRLVGIAPSRSAALHWRQRYISARAKE